MTENEIHGLKSEALKYLRRIENGTVIGTLSPDSAGQIADMLDREFAEIKDQSHVLAYYDEQRNEIRKYINHLREEGHWISFGQGGLFDEMCGTIEYFNRKGSGLIEAHAAFIEHTLIALRALHMIAKSSYGLTHRQISARLDVLCDTIDEAVRVMLDERTKGIDQFTHTPFNRKDWDTRRLASENYKLHKQVEEMQKELAK